MRVILLCALVVSLSACNKWATNQELRQVIFINCMESLPAGPKETVYNDWDEVVEACGEQAYRQARYCKNCD